MGPGTSHVREHPRATRPAFASVLHVNEKGGSFGGTEEYIALLTAALTARGVRSDLACGVVAGELPPELASVHVIDGLASRRPLPGTAAALAEVVAATDADVVYVHNVFDPAVVRAVAELPGRGALVWYVHDHYVTCLTELRWRRDVGSCPHRLGGACLTAVEEGRCVRRHPERTFDVPALEQRLALTASLACADAVVVVSDYMRRLLAEALPTLGARLHRVQRPVRDVASTAHRERRLPTDPTVVVCAGRITGEKGLAVVVEALGAVTSGPIDLRIAGVVEDDAYWAWCRRLLDAAMARNPRLTATYLGHLDYAATDELFCRADVVTIPSQWPEPLGAVALEAMRAGATVVASGIGGLRDTVVDGVNGLLVDPPDVAAWTAAVASLVEDPGLRDRLRRGAAATVAGIGIGAHVDELERIVVPHLAGGRSATDRDARDLAG